MKPEQHIGRAIQGTYPIYNQQDLDRILIGSITLRNGKYKHQALTPEMYPDDFCFENFGTYFVEFQKNINSTSDIINLPEDTLIARIYFFLHDETTIPQKQIFYVKIDKKNKEITLNSCVKQKHPWTISKKWTNIPTPDEAIFIAQTTIIQHINCEAKQLPETKPQQEILENYKPDFASSENSDFYIINMINISNPEKFYAIKVEKQTGNSQITQINN